MLKELLSIILSQSDLLFGVLVITKKVIYMRVKGKVQVKGHFQDL